MVDHMLSALRSPLYLSARWPLCNAPAAITTSETNSVAPYIVYTRHEATHTTAYRVYAHFGECERNVCAAPPQEPHAAYVDIGASRT